MRLIDLTTMLTTRPPRALVEPDRIVAWQHATATHVDAPWHYGPETAGRPARTIEQLPLEWFYGPGVVLDMSARQDGGDLTPADIDDALAGYTVAPGDIVLIRTDLDRTGDSQPHLRMRQLDRPAAEHLLDMGVRVIGIDAVSPDRSGLDDLRAGRTERHFPAHHLGREREYCIVELLTNLDLLPHHGFTVALFPLKVERGSAGWCRAVAFVPDGVLASPPA